MNRIKQLREEFKITQTQLAEKMNKTQQTISLYEKGTNEPDLDGYILLARLFDCSVEYVAGKSNTRNPEKNSSKKSDILDVSGLDKKDIDELQEQIDYKRWKKKNSNEKNGESKNV